MGREDTTGSERVTEAAGNERLPPAAAPGPPPEVSARSLVSVREKRLRFTHLSLSHITGV